MGAEQRRLSSALVIVAIIAGFAGGATLLAWDPRPTTSRSFDAATNGLWLGHRWYTGHGVRDGEVVTPAEVERLLATLDGGGIRYAFVHVGPVMDDGGIADEPGPLLAQLRERAPEVVWLAWLGARVEKIPLRSAAFRAGLIETIGRLGSAGFDGVHLDLEPLHDRHPGYLELLEAIRRTFGDGLLLSQATPRAGPYGVSAGPLRDSFWSEAFYRDAMSRVDQTVVMAYDTRLGFPKGYVAFVAHQTALLGRWSCETPGHELLIGVPSYEDVPIYSDPQVENLRTAALGVRAALEREAGLADCVAGVAIYANWVTDEDEWNDFARYWVAPEDAAR